MAKLISANTERSERQSAARLLAIATEVVAELRPGAAGPGITLDSSFDRNLGLDSLSRVELIARIETAFDVALPENVLSAAESPRDLLRALLAASEALARSMSLSRLELQVRLELVENQKIFGKCGFIETARNAHPGYDRVTEITMQKTL